MNAELSKAPPPYGPSSGVPGSATAPLQRRLRGGSQAPIQHPDDWSGSSAVGKLQALAYHSPRTQQLRAIKQLADNSFRTWPSIPIKPAVAAPIQRKSGNGGLPKVLKQGVESLSGFLMDDVRVHYNSGQPAQLNAHAYAQGTDIHLGPGQEKHLPHEAWHVVQQKQGRVQPTLQRKGAVAINDNPGLEREADAMGSRAMSHVPALRNATPVQRVGYPSSIVQLRTTGERTALCDGFPQALGSLYIGRLSAQSTLRNHATSEIVMLDPGTVIIYQGNLRDSFSKGLTSVVKDHVYAAVVSNATGRLIADPAHWRQGWVVYENIATDSSGSDALHGAAEADSVTLRVRNFLQGIAVDGVLPGRVQNRRNLAPKAIKAWAERTNNPLTDTMPLARLGLGAEHLDNTEDRSYETIDPTGELQLDRVHHESPFFQAAQNFLTLNAAAMPGTMADDHELRNVRLGGDRAREGQAWLASYAGKNLNNADIVAITGATVTNIFINRNAPTWAAYEANLQHHLGTHGFQAGPATWSASATIRGGANDALIDQMTQDRAGEYYLFHGTSKNNIRNISKSGFDPEFVNYTGLKGYGKTGYGTAFTDQFAKALAYSPPERIQADGQPDIYRHYVLVARVFAGRPHQAGDRARRTRGNLELTQHNINYEDSIGNKMKAQGQGMLSLGKPSETVSESYRRGTPLHSTVQDRTFHLRLNAEGEELPMSDLQFRDTSLTISDAIQMYPAYIIECSIPAQHMRSGQRTLPPSQPVAPV
jgi:hypothetical protein